MMNLHIDGRLSNSAAHYFQYTWHLYISRKQLKQLYVLADKSNEIMMERIENKHMWEEKR